MAAAEAERREVGGPATAARRGADGERARAARARASEGGEGSMCMHTHIPKDRLERPVGEGGDQEKGRKKKDKSKERRPNIWGAERKIVFSNFQVRGRRREEHFPRYSCKIVDA